MNAATYPGDPYAAPQPPFLGREPLPLFRLPPLDGPLPYRRWVFPRSHEEARNRLRNRARGFTPRGVRIAHNTRLHLCPPHGDPFPWNLDECPIAIRYHDTDVVIFHPDERITVNTGGWNTPTTCLRLRCAGIPAYCDKGDKGDKGDLVLCGPEGTIAVPSRFQGFRM